MTLLSLLQKYTTLEQMPHWTLTQGVSSLLYDEIVASGVNPFDRRGLMLLSGYTQKQIGRWELQRESIAALARFCRHYHIGMMIFKGYALSQLYDVPTSRRSGDVDVWFFTTETQTPQTLQTPQTPQTLQTLQTPPTPKDTTSEESEEHWPSQLKISDLQPAGDKIDEHLRAKGINVKLSTEKHTVFDIKGSHYENHNYFLDSEGHDQLLEVEDYLQNQTIEQSPEWPNVYYPSADFNAIYLPLHAAQHFIYSGACLKQLVDWPMFLKRCGTQVQWPSIYALAEKIGSRKWFDVLNAIAVQDFDIPVESIGGTDYLHRDPKMEQKVIDAFATNVDVSDHAPFLQLFYQKTKKQFRNRWKIRLVYGENYLLSYLRHAWGYVIRTIKIKN